MDTVVSVPVALRRLAIIAGVTVLGACSDQSPLVPRTPPAARLQLASSSHAEEARLAETLRRVTSRYRRIQAALDDGFVFLHDCETRSEEGPVGTVYVNPARVMDGVADPHAPDALIYEPRHHGEPRLVGVELAILFTGEANEEPPTLLGATFQREDEFGVFGLHVWVWKKNPKGLFAVSNPRVSCAAE
jgi:hypothetical protein